MTTYVKFYIPAKAPESVTTPAAPFVIESNPTAPDPEPDPCLENPAQTKSVLTEP